MKANGFKALVKKMESEMTIEELLMSEAYHEFIKKFVNGVIKTKRKVSFEVVINQTIKPAYIAYTDDRRIVVFLYNVLYVECQSQLEKFMMTLALIAHELGHCFFTSFSELRKWKNSIDAGTWYPNELENCIDLADKGTRSYVSWLGKDLANCLEDGYVERSMCEQFGGIIKEAILFMQRICFNESPMLEKVIEDNGAFQAIRQGILNYATARNFKFADVNNLSDDGKRVYDVLLAVATQIDQYDKASKKEKWMIINTIIGLIWEFRKEEEEQPESGPQSGDQESDQDSDREKEESEGGSGDSEQNEADEANENEASDGKHKSFQPLAGQTPMPERNHNIVIDEESLENILEDVTMQELIKQISKDAASDTATQTCEDEAMRETQHMSGEDNNSDLIGAAVTYLKPGRYPLRTMKDMDERLLRTETQGYKMARQIERYFKVECDTGNKKGLYSGKLNRSALHRRDQKIFMSKGAPQKEINMSVVLLVDRSGSTNSHLEAILADCACTLHSMFEKLQIPCMMLGYRSGYGDLAQNYFETYGCFDVATRNVRKRIMRAAVYDHYQNRDGIFFRNATKVLLGRDEAVKVCIILSDGLPYDAGYYVGQPAEQDTSNAVMDMRKKGIQPVIAGVGQSAAQLKKLYGNEVFLDVTDPSLLSQRMAHVIQKIIRNAKDML